MAGGLLGGDSNRVDLSRDRRQGRAADRSPRTTVRARRSSTRASRCIGPEPQPLPASEPPKLVILWVMDALRADKIPIFTPGARAQTPNFDELAKSSAVFRQYYVQGNESQTSHSSMWTSLYPAVHNVRLAGRGRRVDASTTSSTSSASELDDGRLHTIGVTGNGFVNEDGGYARGFDEYRNMMRETGHRQRRHLRREDRRRRARASSTSIATSRRSCSSARSTPTGRGSRASRGSTSTRRGRITGRSRSSAPRRTSASSPARWAARSSRRRRTSSGCARSTTRAVSYHDQQLGRLDRAAQVRGASGIRRC